jgi:hypothetical protein
MKTTSIEHGLNGLNGLALVYHFLKDQIDHPPQLIKHLYYRELVDRPIHTVVYTDWCRCNVCLRETSIIKSKSAIG